MKIKIVFMAIIVIAVAEEYFFTDLPQIVVDSGYAHVTASVNFTNTEREIKILKYYGQMVKKFSSEQGNDTFLLALHEIVQEAENRVEHEWKELKNLVGDEKKVTRFIATLGTLVIGAIGAGLGLFGMLKSQDLSQLHQSVDQLEQRQDHIVSHIFHQDQHIHQNGLAIIDLKSQLHNLATFMGQNQILTEMDTISLYVTTLTNRLLGQISILKKTIILAKYNRANPDFFSTDFIQNSILKIIQKLPDQYQLISTHYIDWYNFEASMILEPNGFFLALHAPFYNPLHLLSAFHFRSLPIHVQNNSSFLMIKPDSTILGLDKNNKYFIELNEVELQKCNLISSKFVCPQIKVLRKDFEKSCTYQLFRNDQAKAGPLCPKILGPRREMVVEITENTFQFIFPTDKMITEICPNRSQPIPIYHNKKVSVDPHCHLETSSNLIFPTKSFSVATKITTYKIEKIHFESERIPTNNNSTINIDQFESYHDVSKNYHVSHFKFNLTITLSLIIIAVLLTIMCVCFYKRVPASYPPQQ